VPRKRDGKIPHRQKLRSKRVADWAEFAGISVQAMHQWKLLSGFPISDDGYVCLWDLAIWRHQRLNPAELAAAEDLSGGQQSPALERIRMAEAHIRELKLAREESQVLNREIVHERLVEIAGLIRQAGELLQRQCGDDAYRILDDTLNEIEQKIELWFSPSAEPA
jgi:hypothetical protein